jgi:hypothetical protein
MVRRHDCGCPVNCLFRITTVELKLPCQITHVHEYDGGQYNRWLMKREWRCLYVENSLDAPLLW